MYLSVDLGLSCRLSLMLLKYPQAASLPSELSAAPLLYPTLMDVYVPAGGVDKPNNSSSNPQHTKVLSVRIPQTLRTPALMERRVIARGVDVAVAACCALALYEFGSRMRSRSAAVRAVRE